MISLILLILIIWKHSYNWSHRTSLGHSEIWGSDCVVADDSSVLGY